MDKMLLVDDEDQLLSALLLFFI